MTATNLDGQVVLISGAAGGIGAATARRLVDRGAHVVLADLDTEALEALAGKLGDRASAVTLDVTDPEACADAVAAVLADHGRLDVVWADAGTSDFGPVETMPGEAWRRIVEVNLLGALQPRPRRAPSRPGAARLCRGHRVLGVLPALARSQCLRGVEGRTRGAGRLPAQRGRPSGVHVGVFHPGFIATPMVLDKVDHHPAFNALLQSLSGPLRRITPVDELADVLAEAVAKRADKVIYPRRGWLLHALGPLLSTRLLSAGGGRVAPEIRRQSREQRAPAS